MTDQQKLSITRGLVVRCYEALLPFSNAGPWRGHKPTPSDRRAAQQAIRDLWTLARRNGGALS